MARGKIVFSDEQMAFLLSDEAKALKPCAVRTIGEDEAYERFKDIRWGWQKGNPYCPHCGAERPYEVKTRGKFNCRKCGRQFSVTSRTVFSSRKMPFKTLLHVLAIKLHTPMNSMQMADQLSVQYRTAYRINNLLHPYVGNINPSTMRPSEKAWPYTSAGSSGGDILREVNELLPRSLPEQVRADVGQDIVLGVLDGSVDRRNLHAQVRWFIRQHYGNMEWRFDTISLDKTIFDDGGSMHDLISSDTFHF